MTGTEIAGNSKEIIDILNSIDFYLMLILYALCALVGISLAK